MPFVDLLRHPAPFVGQRDRSVLGDAEGEKFFEADTVIYAVGQRPMSEAALALRFCAPEFHQIGDCIIPKNITNATGSAFMIARDIGRF